MDKFIRYLERDNVDAEMVLKKSLILLVIIYTSYILMQIIGKFFRKIMKDEAKVSKLMRVLRVVVIAANFILFLLIYFPDIRALGVVVSLIIAIVALAAKDLIIDIVAYFYILARKPFSMGQVIEVNGIVGELIDLDFLQFNLLEMGDLTTTKTHTGRYVSVPNRYIFEYPVLNYNHTYEYVFVDTSILVDFDDRDEAIKLAGKVAYDKYLQIIDNYDKKDVDVFQESMDSYGEVSKPTVRAELANNGFKIYVQLFTAYYEIGKNKMIMQNTIFDEFRKNNIKMPNPQFLYLENEI